MTEEFKNYDNYYNGFLKECRKHIIKELEQPNMDKAMIRILTKENDDLKVEIGRVRQALNNPTDDCVSRAEMLKYQQYLRGKMSNEENHKLWEFIKDLPPVTPTFPKGATNGDMIKAMFPNQTIGCAIPITDRNGAKFYRTTINGVTDFTEDWWNALYKRGNEDDSN